MSLVTRVGRDQSTARTMLGILGSATLAVIALTGISVVAIKRECPVPSLPASSAPILRPSRRRARLSG